MTKQALWKIITDRNPSFLNDEGTVTLRTRGLKKLFDNAYDEGFYEAFSASRSSSPPKDDPIESLLNMFGKKK